CSCGHGSRITRGSRMDDDHQRHEAAIEAELDSALRRLPVRAVPAELRKRLEALMSPTPATADAPAAPPVPARRPWRGAWVAPFASVCAAAALVLIAVRLTAPGESARGQPSELVTEAVNDHIRVISSTHPVEIESGGIHQVKPWFTGRLEFA